MAVDTPARIAILGAGPIGLEAALYARFLGYDVDLYEQGRIAENVMRWGHVTMFSPFGMNSSPLGLAALRAQDDQYQAPATEALLSGREWAQRYLIPLSQSDLLADHLQESTTVVSVGRQTLLKTELPARPARAESPFRILLRDASQHERAATADIVIDTTGVYDRPNWLGPGGTPALGEIQCRQAIQYHLPDVRGVERHKYANKHSLLIGSGCCAASSVVALAELVQEAPETRVTWITRHPQRPAVRRIVADRLAPRDQLAQAANHCASGQVPGVEHWPGTTVQAIAHDARSGRFEVQLDGTLETRQTFDHVLAHVGYRGNPAIFEELQVRLCYASHGPRQLAAALACGPSSDCLEQTSHQPTSLRCPEPNFYILGAKSYGRNSAFLVCVGLAQIRDLFALIGDRADLDLYRGAKSLPW